MNSLVRHGSKLPLTAFTLAFAIWIFSSPSAMAQHGGHGGGGGFGGAGHVGGTGHTGGFGHRGFNGLDRGFNGVGGFGFYPGFYGPVYDQGFGVYSVGYPYYGSYGTGYGYPYYGNGYGYSSTYYNTGFVAPALGFGN
jgi:hypothetical protein